MNTAIAERVVDLDAVRDARKQIEETESFEAARDMVAQAEGWEALLKSIHESAEKQNECARLKLRAIRRAGQLLAEMKAPSRGRTGPECYVVPEGLTSSKAYEWRRIGTAPETDFERYLETASEPTVAGLKRYLPNRGVRVHDDKVVEQALKLRGRGMNLKQIGEVLGVNRNTVNRWVNQDREIAWNKTYRRNKRKQETERLSQERRKASDPIGDVYPHLRKTIEALQVAVDETDDPDARVSYEMLFPFAYELEDALRRVMKGLHPRTGGK